MGLCFNIALYLYNGALEIEEVPNIKSCFLFLFPFLFFFYQATEI